MTDNEIIKAFECCREGVFGKCNECPLRVPGGDDIFTCLHRKQELTLDLIKRQKAEIERLSNTIADREYSCGELAAALQTANELLKTEKSEAIKEFAMRLKDGVPQETGVIRCADVDNLVKEMTEEKIFK